MPVGPLGPPGPVGPVGRAVPAVRFDHLDRLTDDGGLHEHALGRDPRPEHGYCVDDVARGLLVAAREPAPDARVDRLRRQYLAFVVAARGRGRRRATTAEGVTRSGPTGPPSTTAGAGRCTGWAPWSARPGCRRPSGPTRSRPSRWPRRGGPPTTGPPPWRRSARPRCCAPAPTTPAPGRCWARRPSGWPAPGGRPAARAGRGPSRACATRTPCCPRCSWPPGTCSPARTCSSAAWSCSAGCWTCRRAAGTCRSCPCAGSGHEPTDPATATAPGRPAAHRGGGARRRVRPRPRGHRRRPLGRRGPRGRGVVPRRQRPGRRHARPGHRGRLRRPGAGGRNDNQGAESTLAAMVSTLQHAARLPARPPVPATPEVRT